MQDNIQGALPVEKRITMFQVSSHPHRFCNEEMENKE